MLAPDLGPFFIALLVSIFVVLCGGAFVIVGKIRVIRANRRDLRGSTPRIGSKIEDSTNQEFVESASATTSTLALDILAVAVVVNPLIVFLVLFMLNALPYGNRPAWYVSLCILPFLVSPALSLTSLVLAIRKANFLVAVGAGLVCAIYILGIVAVEFGK